MPLIMIISTSLDYLSCYLGSTYEVLLNVDPSKARIGESECERLFGVVPAKFSKMSASGENRVSAAAGLTEY